METRSLIIGEAARLLAESASGDVSTRAICDAAGVTQPVLYRLFGDKDGLLAAVADDVWEQYLAAKRSAEASDDPLEDLRSGWDNHTAFALAHPHAYRLVFGTRLTTAPEAAAEAMRLLTAVLERLAARGRLRMPPEDAARVVMAANSGVALGLVLHPDMFPDPSSSVLVRDAVLGAILVPRGDDADEPAEGAAITLRAGLAGSAIFTAAEAGLLDEWLARIQNEDAR